MAPLPQETFQVDVRAMTKKLLQEIEEKSTHFQRMGTSARKREEEMKEEKEKEWEHARDQRVKSWRKFKDSRLNGHGKHETRAPKVRAEERSDYAPKVEGKPMGFRGDKKR